MSHTSLTLDVCGFDVCDVAESMSHVTHMHESCHTHPWVMSHTSLSLNVRGFEVCDVAEFMSHVTHTLESCYTHPWVMSHIPMLHVTHIHESCHTHPDSWCVWIWGVWDGRINESCHTYPWVMPHTSMSHVTHILTLDVCDITQAYLWCDTILNVY